MCVAHASYVSYEVTMYLEYASHAMFIPSDVMLGPRLNVEGFKTSAYRTSKVTTTDEQNLYVTRTPLTMTFSSEWSCGHDKKSSDVYTPLGGRRGD